MQKTVTASVNGYGWGVHVRKWSYGVDSGRVGPAYLAAWTILTGTRVGGGGDTSLGDVLRLPATLMLPCSARVTVEGVLKVFPLKPISQLGRLGPRDFLETSSLS